MRAGGKVGRLAFGLEIHREWYLLLQVNVPCRSADIKCSWMGQRDHLDDHLSKCTFEPLRLKLEELQSEREKLVQNTREQQVQIQRLTQETMIKQDQIQRLTQETRIQQEQIQRLTQQTLGQEEQIKAGRREIQELETKGEYLNTLDRVHFPSAIPLDYRAERLVHECYCRIVTFHALQPRAP